MKLSLSTKISEINNVGKTTATRLSLLDIHNIKNLLFHFPVRYDDFSKTIPISEIVPNQQFTIQAKVEQIKSRRSFGKRKMTIIEALVSDETGSIKIMWFNQFYIPKHLQPGDVALFSGKASLSKYGLQIMSPVYEKFEKTEKIHTGGLVPVYPTTLKISQKQIRYLIKSVLPLSKHLEEYLPTQIITAENLIPLQEAIYQIHFPKNKQTQKKARERLAFDELFLIQIITLNSKQQLKNSQAEIINFQEKTTLKFTKSLPFTLTTSQKKATWEILKNMEKNHPMNRLLEGDVGSGKTIVAALAILNTAHNNLQSALMVPTEILAWQHYLQLAELFKNQHQHIAILTSSLHSVARGINGPRTINIKRIIEEIKSGKISLVIGTHSLIQDRLEFKNLGLAIIDEQHRFGVSQRKKLIEKSGNTQTQPHFLSMTATPIPRSLALSLYGDLDISIIDELPIGRKKIKTTVVNEKDRVKTYEFISKRIKAGDQVFVICPLIEESDKLGIKSAKKEFEKLQNEIFPEFTIGLIHGKMKQTEKEKVMREFKENKIKILTATSIIEVGVDIPNATIMIIEDAQRFGLAQLHQFRGRVGRSDKQAYCFLFSESAFPETQQRLQALAQSNNGFELAELDLELRGPGEIFGIKQSGLPTTRIASLSNMTLIKKTRNWAEKILTNSWQKDYPKLYAKIKNNLESIHFE